MLRSNGVWSDDRRMDGWSRGERGAVAEMPRWQGAAGGRTGLLLRKGTAGDDGGGGGGKGVPGSAGGMRRGRGDEG